MATRWAISDGDWNTDSIWNDGTNLGIPADGDTVYLNGHSLTVDNLPLDTIDNYYYLFSPNTSSIIRNDANADYNIVDGGYVSKTVQGNIKINASLYANGTLSLVRMNCTSTANKGVIINGDIYGYGSSIVFALYGSTTSNRVLSLAINGNISIFDNARVCTPYSLTLNVNAQTIRHNSTNIMFNTTNTLNYVNITANDIIIDGGGSLLTALVPNGALSFVGNITLANNSYIMKRTGSTSVTFTTANNITINGNLTISDNSKFLPLVATSNNAPTFTLNGNLYLNNTTSVTNPVGTNTNQEYILFAYFNTMLFNGSIICTGSCTGRLMGGQLNYGSITINGNIDMNGDIAINITSQRVTNFGVSCEFIRYNSSWLFPITLTKPYNVNNPNGINVIYTGDSTPEFLILGKYNLNNTNQYPTPANVKKDVPYAWGYMNGMMLPDYPQPANVLKDIEYGRHCAGRNDIVTYDNDRYVYVKIDGEYHWEIEHITSTDVTAVVDTAQLSTAYKGVTTTDIVTNPTANPVIINGTSTNISTDQYVRYGHSVYKWNGSEWILYQTDPKNVPTISIDGTSVTAVDGYVVKYTGNNKYYMWNSTDIEWQEQTMNYLGETTTDVTLSPSPQYVTLPYSISENSYIGTLDVPSTQAIVTAINQSTIATNVNTLLQRLSDGLTQRLGQSVTIPILQQILDAHLN